MFIGSLEPVSNKATWAATFEVRDAETDELIDLSSLDEIVVQIRGSGRVLSASLSNGKVTIVDTGVFRWVFSSSDMGTLVAKTYQVGCLLTGNGEKAQFMIGTLPVLDGIVQ